MKGISSYHKDHGVKKLEIKKKNILEIRTHSLHRFVLPVCLWYVYVHNHIKIILLP